MRSNRFIHLTLGFFALLAATASCSTDEPVVPKSKLELVQNTWVVGEAFINSLPQTVTPGGFGAIRITFTETTYSWRFPAYGAEAAAAGVTPGTVITQTGTWAFGPNEATILLTAQGATAPFQWTLHQLTFGNLQVEYSALNPITGGNATYRVHFTIGS